MFLKLSGFGYTLGVPWVTLDAFGIPWAPFVLIGVGFAAIGLLKATFECFWGCFWVPCGRLWLPALVSCKPLRSFVVSWCARRMTLSGETQSRPGEARPETASLGNR